MAQSKVEIPATNPNSFRWKEKFFFRDNKVLTVIDNATFDPSGNMAERSFSYDFRERGSGDPIFRVCNHTNAVYLSVTDPCHVHVGSDDNVIECFSDSNGKDFPYAIRCVKKFYLGKTQDWDGGDDIE